MLKSEHFFHAFGKCNIPFLSLGHFPIFNPLCFQCYEISTIVPVMWSFWWYHFLWNFFIPFITSIFLIYDKKYTLAKFPSYISRVSQMASMLTFPWPVISPRNSIWMSLSALPLFWFFAALPCKTSCHVYL